MTKERKTERDKFLSAAEVGEWLGMGKRTVLEMMKNGELTGYHLGNAYKFKESDIKQYIERNKYVPGQNVVDEEE